VNICLGNRGFYSISKLEIEDLTIEKVFFRKFGKYLIKRKSIIKRFCSPKIGLKEKFEFQGIFFRVCKQLVFSVIIQLIYFVRKILILELNNHDSFVLHE
jgi:hypothetical protein